MRQLLLRLQENQPVLTLMNGQCSGMTRAGFNELPLQWDGQLNGHCVLTYIAKVV